MSSASYFEARTADKERVGRLGFWGREEAILDESIDLVPMRTQLTLGRPLLTGQSRDIFAHPNDAGWLIKIGRGETADSVDANQLELRNYLGLRDELGDYLTTYHNRLWPTTRGPGLLCKKVLDSDGSLSRPWSDWAACHPEKIPQMMACFEQFFECLLAKRHYFFDFNDRNFLLQQSDLGNQLKFIDLKSYRLDRALLPVTRWFEGSAKRKMLRRRDRFMERWFGEFGSTI